MRTAVFFNRHIFFNSSDLFFFSSSFPLFMKELCECKWTNVTINLLCPIKLSLSTYAFGHMFQLKLRRHFVPDEHLPYRIGQALRLWRKRLIFDISKPQSHTHLFVLNPRGFPTSSLATIAFIHFLV